MLSQLSLPSYCTLEKTSPCKRSLEDRKRSPLCTFKLLCVMGVGVATDSNTQWGRRSPHQEQISQLGSISSFSLMVLSKGHNKVFKTSRLTYSLSFTMFTQKHNTLTLCSINQNLQKFKICLRDVNQYGSSENKKSAFLFSLITQFSCALHYSSHHKVILSLQVYFITSHTVRIKLKPTTTLLSMGLLF